MAGENEKVNIGQMAAFPAVFMGFGALTATKRAGWSPKKAIENLEIENFKKLNPTIKSTNKDIFTRSKTWAQNYTTLRDAQKESYKLAKKAAKKGATQEIKQASQQASDNLKTLKENLKNGKLLAQAEKQSVGKAITGEIKGQLTSKFNIGLSVLLTFVPAFKEKVVPAFKEEGIGSGIKELGKAVIQTCTDLVGYAAGGSIGGVVGGILGAIAAPFTGGLSASVGSFLGNMVGSMLIGGKITKTVNKVIGADEEYQSVPQEEAVQQQEIEQEQTVAFSGSSKDMTQALIHNNPAIQSPYYRGYTTSYNNKNNNAKTLINRMG